jgi:hypothetical protein
MTENKNAKTPADGPEYERGFVEGMQRQMQLHVNRVIKTWNERCEEHPDHQERIITERMIQARMQEEIDELRQALEAYGGNCYGDGTVYRGQRSKDSAVQTYKAKLKEKNHG